MSIQSIYYLIRFGIHGAVPEDIDIRIGMSGARFNPPDGWPQTQRNRFLANLTLR
jgi:hypothetical protein